MHPGSSALGLLLSAGIAIGTGAAPALAQLAPKNVLVVYDSRIADSRLVAEHYAGSAAIDNPDGKKPGTRPGVLTVDLAILLKDVPNSTITAGACDYGQFCKWLRDPLRAYLTKENLQHQIRVLALTKGLPHVIADMKNVIAGDQPPIQDQHFRSGNATGASVDSELTLIYQDLAAGEAGGPGDSLADGLIINPYWHATQPITFSSTEHILTKRTLTGPGGKGAIWTSDEAEIKKAVSGTPFDPARILTPGDILLTARLDGPTVADVYSMLDRGKDVYFNLNAHTIVLDEADSNGLTDAAPNKELDNMAPLWGGDDFEQTRDLFKQDGRLSAAGLFYDALAGTDHFCVGPRYEWSPNAKVITRPVILLSSYGNNAAGKHPTVKSGPKMGQDAGICYAESFTWAPGAVFLSIESFNARDFGNLGGWPGQQQISNYLAAGGTFAIGNAQEPFAFTTPDTLPLAANFFLGDLTFVEAAWSGIPAISWQQVVIGDPLARITRSSEDINMDRTVDDKDLAAWDALDDTKDKARKDLNRDGACDAKDRAIIEHSVAVNKAYAEAASRSAK
jgi:hypothetical protein